jgi:hypothetical protein
MFLIRSPPSIKENVTVISIYSLSCFTIVLIGFKRIYYFYDFLDSKSIRADIYTGIAPTIKSFVFNL